MSKDINEIIDSSEIISSKKWTIKRGFKAAKGARESSDWKGPKLGCCIIYKNKVLTTGWNKDKETALQKKFNKHRHFDADVYKNGEHAEIHAIRNLLHDYDLKDLDVKKLFIFTYRELKDGSLGLAKPCIACEMAIRKIGIRNVFYTGDNSVVYEVYDGEKEKKKE